MFVTGHLQLDSLAGTINPHLFAAQFGIGTLTGVANGQAAMSTGKLEFKMIVEKVDLN